MRKPNLRARVLFETAEANPNVTTETGSFKIRVKDDNDEVVYQNDEESYEYHQVPSLETALEYFGAKLTDEQKTFLTEALAGDESIGKAVKSVIDVVNSDLQETAKRNRYSSVFQQHKPMTEENIANATASIVRNFIKTANVSDETAIERLKMAEIIPSDYTLEDFRSNKGKR